MLLVCIRSNLNPVLRYKYLILDTYHPETLTLREQRCEEPWLFFEVKWDPTAITFGKQCCRAHAESSKQCCRVHAESSKQCCRVHEESSKQCCRVHTESSKRCRRVHSESSKRLIHSATVNVTEPSIKSASGIMRCSTGRGLFIR